jgi:hypothetical protein
MSKEISVTKNIFISYSRREVGFVDELAGRLEDEQYNVWLDYRSLVPGKPWEEQIFQGIRDADTILLVISKSSIASNNVASEWKHFLDEKNKRIILIIFEAVDLPAELENYEWVDFRGNYQNALNELNRRLQSTEPEKQPVPQTGFKIPSIVWVAFALSAAVSLLSIGTIWTLFIPFLLIPLPYRIMKRDFHYMPVQAALVMLPFALYLTSLFSTNDTIGYAVDSLIGVSVPVVLALMFVLRSAGMQRWGKPEATLPIFSSHQKTEYPAPKPISFFVEHAPQDRFIATEIAEALQADGHHPVADIGSADSVFTLVSAFKSDSEVDTQKKIVYPVIVQTNNKVSKQLSKVQWMDFRPGVRNLEAVGKLLNEPQKLLRVLGIRPMGNQVVLPATIMYLNYFIVFLAVVCIGSWFPYVLQYFPDVQETTVLDTSMVQLVISLVLFGVLAFFMARQLVNRKGLFASYFGLITGTIGLGLIIYWQTVIDSNVLDALNLEVDDRGYSSLYPEYLFIYGGLLMLIYLIIKWKDLRRWLPARKS